MNPNDDCSEANGAVHGNARECTVSAGAPTHTVAQRTDSEDPLDGNPVHGNARFCTIPAGGVGEGGNPGEVGETLRERQLTAMGLLLLGKPYLAVARAVGVDPSTLYRWRKDDAFRAELERRAEEMWDGAGVRLRALVHPALDVLEEEVHDEYDRSRVRAAGMILRFANLRNSAAPRRAER